MSEHDQLFYRSLPTWKIALVDGWKQVDTLKKTSKIWSTIGCGKCYHKSYLTTSQQTWDKYTWRDRKHLFIPVVRSDPGPVPLWYVNVSILSCVLWTLSGLSAVQTNCAAGGARNNDPDFANKSGHFLVLCNNKVTLKGCFHF